MELEREWSGFHNSSKEGVLPCQVKMETRERCGWSDERGNDRCKVLPQLRGRCREVKAIDLELSKESSVWNSNLTGGTVGLWARTQNHRRPGVALRIPCEARRIRRLRNSLRSDKCAAQGPDSAALLGHAEGGKTL